MARLNVSAMACTQPFHVLDVEPTQGAQMFATRDIKKFEGLFHEVPLLMGCLEERDPSADKYILRNSSEAARLTGGLAALAATTKGRVGAARYPPAARKMMDRMCELVTTVRLAKKAMVPAYLKRFWKLADCHAGDVDLERCVVCVAGLVSEEGMRLNGSMGVAKAKVADSADNRWEVEFETGSAKSIRACNLKTAGGIARTNGFDLGHGACFLVRACSRVKQQAGGSFSTRGAEPEQAIYSCRALSHS